MHRQIEGRVLMLSINPIKGGGETHDAKLASFLARRYVVHGIVCNPWLQNEMAAAGVAVTRVDAIGIPARYWLCLLALFRVCLTYRPSIAHLNGQGEAYFAPLLRLLGVKTVITRHAPLCLDNNWLKQRLVNFCFGCGDQVICVSSLILREMETIIPRKRLVLIPNWIKDADIVEPRTIQSKPRPFRLLFVGRLVKFKGAADLIEAMKLLEGCELKIVGDGPDRAMLESIATGLPVTFHGLVHDCMPFYDGADLFVFPSYPSLEGQGQTPLEAMARGLPSLVSDIEVVLETVENGRVAGVFRCGDVRHLAEQVKLMQDPILLAKLSHAGIDRIRHVYSASVVQPMYFKLFDDLLRTLQVSMGAQN